VEVNRNNHNTVNLHHLEVSHKALINRHRVLISNRKVLVNLKDSVSHKGNHRAERLEHSINPRKVSRGREDYKQTRYHLVMTMMM
jgi:hypothetical protein